MLRDLIVIAILLFGAYHAIRAPFYALLLYLWVAYFRPHSWVWSDWLYTIQISTLVALLVVGYTLAVHRRYSLNLFQSLLVFFCILTGVSCWQSMAIDYSWTWYQDFLKIAVMTYLITILAKDIQQLRLAILVICVSLGFEPAKQGLTDLIFHMGARNLNPMPHLGDNNGVGLGMAMLVALVLALMRTSRNPWEKYALGLMCVGVAYRGLSTYSRGAFLAFAVLGLMVWLQGHKKIRLMAAGVCLVALVGAFMPQMFFERMETITEVTTDEGVREKSAASRLHLWQVAMIMAQDRPWTGVGFNAYSQLYDHYDTSDGLWGSAKAAHGTLPGMLADNGYPATVVYILLVGTALLYTMRVRQLSRYVKSGAANHHLATGIQQALVCFLVGGAFLSYMYFEIIWHMMGLATACYIVTHRQMVRQVLRRTDTLPSTPGVFIDPGGMSPTPVGSMGAARRTAVVPRAETEEEVDEAQRPGGGLVR